MRKDRLKETFIILLVLAIYFHIESCRSMAMAINNNYNNSTDSNNFINNEYYGVSPVERQNFALHRHRRFFEPMTITTSLVLTLFLWNFLAGPFLQAQLSLKINVASWFQPEGCAHRTWNNGLKRGVFKCMPTNDEIYERELAQQMYQQMFDIDNLDKDTAQLLLFKHNLLMDMPEPPESLENLSTRENLYLLLFKYRLVPFDVGRIPETLLKKEDVHAMRISNEFTEVWQTENIQSTEECKKLVADWKKKRAEKFMKKEKYYPLLQCECMLLQSDWTQHGFRIDLQTVGNCIDLLMLKSDMADLDDAKLKKFAEETNGAKDGEENDKDTVEVFHDSLTVLPEGESDEERKELAKIANEFIEIADQVERQRRLRNMKEMAGQKQNKLDDDDKAEVKNRLEDKLEEPTTPNDKAEVKKWLEDKLAEQKRLDVIFAEVQTKKRQKKENKMKELWEKLKQVLNTSELEDEFLNGLEKHLMVKKGDGANESDKISPISSSDSLFTLSATDKTSSLSSSPMESESDNDDVNVKLKKKESAGMMDNLEGIIPSGIIFFKRLWHGKDRTPMSWPEEYQCQAPINRYAENCLTIWEPKIESAEKKLTFNNHLIGKLVENKEKSYPECLVQFLKKIWKVSKKAAQRFDNSKFRTKLKVLATNPDNFEHIKQMFVMIEMRRAVCDVQAYGMAKWKEENAKQFRKKWKKFVRKLTGALTSLFRRGSRVPSADSENGKTPKKVKEKKVDKNLPKDFLKKFDTVCKNFYAQNKKERRELLALEGFGTELDGFWRNVKVDEEYEKWKNDPVTVERLKALKKEEAELLEEKKAKLGQIVSNGYKENLGEDFPEENTVEKKRKKCKFLKGSSWINCFRSLGRRPRRKREATNDDRSHKLDHYFGSNIYSENGSENGDKSLKVYEGNGVVRKKRFAVATIVGFALSLVFLQIYLRIHQKYDPVTWLWMCIKHPTSWCQVPAAIKKEVAFIKDVKQIVVQEMKLKTVAKLRKLYEIAYVQYLYHYGKKALVLPSQFLANKLKISLNIRHRYLLDCYTYNWEADGKFELVFPTNTSKMRNALAIILTDLINATKAHCISFTDIMPKEDVPELMVHFSKHCSQIGGNL